MAIAVGDTFSDGSTTFVVKKFIGFPMGSNETDLSSGHVNTTSNFLLNSLDLGDSVPVGSDYYICQWVNGNSLSNNTYLRRPTSKIVDYVKSIHPLISSFYVSGTSWYIVYSNGWIEQGGVIPKSTTSVTLHKPFANTNYGILMVGRDYTQEDQVLGANNLTKTGFTVRASSYTRTWRAFGF